MDTNQLISNIGYFGTLLTSITFIPQVYKTWKSKSVGDLSMTMIVIVITSTIVWLIYGYLRTDGPVMVANLVVFALTMLLLYFKNTYKSQIEEKEEDNASKKQDVIDNFN
jgi:MtN3 and saliva related transmembrane protein